MWTPWYIWNSPDIRRNLFPDVIFVGFVASCVTYYNNIIVLTRSIDEDGDGIVTQAEVAFALASKKASAVHTIGMEQLITNDMLTLPLTPFTLSSIAIGMMLTFRTQNCNARYVEARTHWGAMINETRALSARILALVPRGREGSEVGRARVHALKCIMTFPHALKYHLTVDGFCPDLPIQQSMSDAEVNAVKGVALRKELQSIWDYDDSEEKAYVDRLLDPSVGSRPLHVLHELAMINGRVFKQPAAEGGAGLDTIETNQIFLSVTRFQDVLGACERLYKTPIYTGYTRFMSRVVFIWTNCLPLALYPLLGPVGTVPCSMIIALFMYGLEDVGTRIEEPFDSLPLWQYVDGIDGSIKQMMAQDNQLQNLPMYGLKDVGTRIEEPFDSLPLWQYVNGINGIDGSIKQMMPQDKQHLQNLRQTP